jgi:hypothetical protein
VLDGAKIKSSALFGRSAPSRKSFATLIKMPRVDITKAKASRQPLSCGLRGVTQLSWPERLKDE